MLTVHFRHPVQLYETFKRFATAVSCKLFLDLDWKEDKLQFDTITSIATLHWHGLYIRSLNWLFTMIFFIGLYVNKKLFPALV